jgi:2-polyprenyl-3-methyl-5-hydroxy-6-metoxy-1,4-benzoquinol methylase
MTEEKPHILLAIPTRDNVSARCTASLAHAVMYMIKKGYKIDIIVHTQESLIQRARDGIATMFVEDYKHCEYLMQIDSDISFPKDAIEKLIEQDKDVIGGIYRHKQDIVKITAVPVNKFDSLKEFYNPIECEDVSTGFLLVKRKVFEALKDKVQKYKAHGRDHYQFFPCPIVERVDFNTGEKFTSLLSEDWGWCALARKHGFKLYAMHVGLGHDRTVNMNFEDYFKDKCGLVEMLAAYLQEDVHKVATALINGQMLVALEWKEQNPKTEEEIQNFYKTAKNYIFDLEAHHMRHFVAMRDQQLLQTIFQKEGEMDILDMGSGVGTNSIDIAINAIKLKRNINVYAYDFKSPTNKWARYKAYELGAKVNWIYTEEEMKARKYDAILCFDVLEHLPQQQLLEMIDTLHSLKKDKDSKVFYTIDLTQNQPTHPMHLARTPEQVKEIEDKLKELQEGKNEG